MSSASTRSGRHDRQPGMEAQALDVRQGFQLTDQRLQFGGRQRQGVAAGQQKFADGAVFGQIVDGLLPLVGGRVFFGIRKMPPEAIPAVDRAGAGGHQKGAALVFVQDAGQLARCQVADGILAEARNLKKFVVQRQNLAQQAGR